MIRRSLQLLIGVALAAWTIYWLISGRAYMQEHSLVMQQGLGGDGLQMWEVFDLKMVAAHHLVRWLAGFVPAALLLMVLRRGRRPGDVAMLDDQRPLATAGAGE